MVPTAERVPFPVRPTPPLRYAESSGATPGDIRFRMDKPQAQLSQVLSNRKLVLAGQVAFLPTGILTTILGPMLPILIARWAINDTQAGNLFLVQFLASLVGVQLSGVLLARFGFRPAFLLGLLLMAGGVATPKAPIRLRTSTSLRNTTPCSSFRAGRITKSCR